MALATCNTPHMEEPGARGPAQIFSASYLDVLPEHWQAVEAAEARGSPAESLADFFAWEGRCEHAEPTCKLCHDERMPRLLGWLLDCSRGPFTSN